MEDIKEVKRKEANEDILLFIRNEAFDIYCNNEDDPKLQLEALRLILDAYNLEF